MAAAQPPFPFFFPWEGNLPFSATASPQDFRDSQQREHKGVDGKPFQNKMLCDKYIYQELEQRAVGKDGTQPPVLDAALEHVGRKAVKGRQEDIEEPVSVPEITSGIFGIPGREHGGNDGKQGIEEQVAQKGNCKDPA